MTNLRDGTVEVTSIDQKSVVVGYKGKTLWDAGYFYCPYNPFAPWYIRKWVDLKFWIASRWTRIKNRIKYGVSEKERREALMGTNEFVI